MAQGANSFVNFTRYMRINSLKPWQILISISVIW